MLRLPSTIHLYGALCSSVRQLFLTLIKPTTVLEWWAGILSTIGQITGVLVFAAPRSLETWTWPFSGSDDIVLAGEHCLPNIIFL